MMNISHIILLRESHNESFLEEGHKGKESADHMGGVEEHMDFTMHCLGPSFCVGWSMHDLWL